MLLAWAWYIKKLNTDANFCIIYVTSVWKCPHTLMEAVFLGTWIGCVHFRLLFGIIHMPWNVWYFQNRRSRDKIQGKHWIKTVLGKFQTEEL